MRMILLRQIDSPNGIGMSLYMAEVSQKKIS